MENQNNLTLDNQAVDALRISAKWTMFLSIVGFIFIGLMLIGAAFMAMAPIPEPGMGGMGPGMGGGPFGMLGAIRGFLTVLYVIVAVIYFFPIYYLYKYSKGVKDAIAASNSDLLSEALVNLKSHHKFLGIMTIIVIAIYILSIIGISIFAASMASGMH